MKRLALLAATLALWLPAAMARLQNEAASPGEERAGIATEQAEALPQG